MAQPFTIVYRIMTLSVSTAYIGSTRSIHLDPSTTISTKVPHSLHPITQSLPLPPFTIQGTLVGRVFVSPFFVCQSLQPPTLSTGRLALHNCMVFESLLTPLCLHFLKREEHKGIIIDVFMYLCKSIYGQFLCNQCYFYC